ncbi:MAG: hypothetical protein QXJ14_02550 [Candidatus Aenigmatarchaeota archaeon]
MSEAWYFSEEEFKQLLEERKISESENVILNAIKNAITEATKTFFKYIEEIRFKIERKDFTGAMILILQIAIPAFIVFIIVDLLCTKFVGVGLELEGLRKILRDFLRVDLFVSAVLGAWIGAGIKSPAEQIANYIFRPAILSQSSAVSCYLKGIITEKEFYDIMARHGVPTDSIIYAVQDASRPPSTAELARMYQYVDISDSNLKYLLKQNLVVEDYIVNLYLKYFRALRMREEYSMYQSFLKSAYVDGLINDLQLENELKKFKLSSEELEVVMTTTKNLAFRQLTKIEIDTLTWYYRKGLIDENTFFNKLIQLQIRREVANAIVKNEAARKGIVWEAPSP